MAYLFEKYARLKNFLNFAFFPNSRAELSGRKLIKQEPAGRGGEGRGERDTDLSSRLAPSSSLKVIHYRRISSSPKTEPQA